MLTKREEHDHPALTENIGIYIRLYRISYWVLKEELELVQQKLVKKKVGS